MRFGKDGRLYAVNPEAGFFGVAPGTGPATNRNAVETLYANAIYTNIALTADGDVWWEGLSDAPPAGLTDWSGAAVDPAAGKPAAHPNARFTVPAEQCPVIAAEWDDPAGVPISAILFGGRRADGGAARHRIVQLAARRVSRRQHRLGRHRRRRERVGALRRDPFAMLPFCGYNIARLFRALAAPRRAASRTTSSCRASTSSTGSARARTASSSGRASATTRAC